MNDLPYSMKYIKSDSLEKMNIPYTHMYLHVFISGLEKYLFLILSLFKHYL